MDSSLISSVVGAAAGQAQVAVAAKFMRMSADSSNAIAAMLDAASQNAQSLANVAAGVGTNLNVTA
jgi:hypothetical protein